MNEDKLLVKGRTEYRSHHKIKKKDQIINHEFVTYTMKYGSRPEIWFSAIDHNHYTGKNYWTPKEKIKRKKLPDLLSIISPGPLAKKRC
jgi:hypothetical protein